MEFFNRFRIPILTGVGALVLVIVVYAAWISPEGNKLSGLRAQETQLQSQQAHLQAELASLKRANAHLAANCQLLTRALDAVPGTPSVDSFFHQVSALAVASGDPNTPSISVTEATGGTQSSGSSSSSAASASSSAGGVSGAKPVAVTLTLSGTYGQMTTFIRGLSTFPRLFTINSITVTGGPIATGGQSIDGNAGGYGLTLNGNIYYSSGQVNVCTNASTAAAHS
jgi:Tfp pilus assembly protein PilO